MTHKLLSYLSIYALASVKFTLAPAAGYGLGLSVLEIVLCSVAGMATTALLVPFFAEKLLAYLRKRRERSGTKKKVFSKRNRWIVKVYLKFGVWGIALLTPILLSPVVGCMVAVSFGVKRSKIFLSMFLSGVFWAISLSLAMYFFGDIFLKK